MKLFKNNRTKSIGKKKLAELESIYDKVDPTVRRKTWPKYFVVTERHTGVIWYEYMFLYALNKKHAAWRAERKATKNLLKSHPATMNFSNGKNSK